MICLGESLVQRGSGKTEKIIGDQLLKATSLLNADKPFILAYEPVWAIGTGQVATPEMAEEAHAFLRQRLTDLFSAHKAQNTAILYGGSVKPDNVGNLIKQKNIDGFLVGGASLEVESFVQIVKSTL